MLAVMKAPPGSSTGSNLETGTSRSASRSERTRTRHGCALCPEGAKRASSTSSLQTAVIRRKIGTRGEKR